jgi:tRNA(adenine34) deaminase
MAMRAALTEARAAMAAGELPYGAVVIDATGAVIARAQDRVLRDADPTRHAEIDAVRAAVAGHGPDLSGCALVSTTEPCAMCATAAWWAGIGTIGYGLSQDELFAIRPDAMDEPGLTVAQSMARFHRKPSVLPGLLAGECRALW